MTYTLLATAPLGLESIVARELTELGYPPTQIENGRIFFCADALGVARCNLWLRTSDRVHIVAGRFPARTFEELFAGTSAFPWADILPRDARFPVSGRSQKSVLHSVPACQAIVKKAIVKRLQEHYRQEWFEETGDDYAIDVSLVNDEALLTLDTSGDGLHKRGYRTPGGIAPIKETLAAALILLSRWAPHRPFADPLCGTGTLAIEAALLGRRMAPGLRRTFAAEAFSFIAPETFATAREEARDLILPTGTVDISGSDHDGGAITLCRDNARRAGVQDDIAFTQRPLRQFAPDRTHGCIVTNPPYGERLGDDREIRMLYKELGALMNRAPTWSLFVIASRPDFEKLLGRRADKNRKLYNGRIECRLFQYLGPLPPRT